MKSYKALLIIVLLLSVFGCVQNVEDNRKNGHFTELDTISFENLSEKSYEYLMAQQEICEKKYKMGSYQHWFYDQMTGKLTFSNNNKTMMIADYEDIGSLSLKSNTWLWSWDNATIEDPIKQKILIVKELGLKREFTKLFQAYWKADEYDAWEMSAIACYVLKAKGVYRVPVNDSQLLSFMLLKNINLIDTNERN